MGQFDTFVAVQVTDEGERDYEFPECLLDWILPWFVAICVGIMFAPNT